MDSDIEWIIVALAVGTIGGCPTLTTCTKYFSSRAVRLLYMEAEELVEYKESPREVRWNCPGVAKVCIENMDGELSCSWWECLNYCDVEEANQYSLYVSAPEIRE